jgi:hypothetical protein
VYDAPYLVVPKTNAPAIAGATTVFETKDYAVRRMPAPGLVSPVEVTGALPAGLRPAVHAAALTWFRSDQPLKDRVLEYPTTAGLGGLRVAPHASVTGARRQDSPGDAPDIVAEVDATAPTTIMARESWHPRWRAYIDGRRAPRDRLPVPAPGVGVGGLARMAARPTHRLADHAAAPRVALAQVTGVSQATRASPSR